MTFTLKVGMVKLQYNIRPHDNAFQIYLTDPEGNWIEVNQRQ